MAATERVLLTATNGPLILKGGRYHVGVFASAWNGDTLAPLMVEPNGNDGIGLMNRRGLFPQFTANGFDVFDLPACQVDFAWGALATNPVMSFTTIPNQPEWGMKASPENIVMVPGVSYNMLGGRFMFAVAANYNGGTIGLAAPLPDGTFGFVPDMRGVTINGGAAGNAAGINLVDLAPGIVKLITTGNPIGIFALLSEIPET